MKQVILCGDGMGDNPLLALGNRTLLQVSAIPFMRRLAARGNCAMARTVPDELPPGSDVANLGLLGYDARTCYTGRAPIEAAGAGIPLGPDEVAYRCNLVHIDEGRMTDYSAGHITSVEGEQLVASLNAAMSKPGFRFHAGVGYRHLLIWRNGPVAPHTQAPHDIADQPIESYLPVGERAAELLDCMSASRPLFAGHPVNAHRRDKGLRTATQIWLWGQGRAMSLEPFNRRFGLSGGIISAVDLVRGIGRLAGLDAPRVPGATGFLDTRYDNKVAATLEQLDRGNFAYLHIEAPDECGHLGDAVLKQRAIEDFDRQVVGPVWQALEARGQRYQLIVAMDHRTPVAVRGHTRERVPILALEGPTGPLINERPFDETIDAPLVDSWDWVADRLQRR